MELLLLLVLIVAGALLTKLNLIKPSGISWANKWIIYIALPAVALAKIPQQELGAEMLIPFLSACTIFLLSVFIFMFLLLKKFTRDKRIVLTIVSGLGNTSFIGFPLINFYFGSDYLPVAVIFDQGSFFLFSTGALYLTATRDGSYNIASSVKRIFQFPPFLGLLVALILPSAFFHDGIQLLLEFLGKTISPVAMVVVGYQITRFVNFEFSTAMIYGLGYKLLIAPSIVFLLMSLTKVSEMVFKICIFEAAMAPMITPAILLTELNIESKLVAQMLCWGIFISFISSGIVFLML